MISFVLTFDFVFLGLKLEKDFYNVQTDRFDISKVPDIYDTIKYDLLHNQNIFQGSNAEDLYVCSKALADLVVPQEYGMTVDEKLSIARGIVTPLLRKIRAGKIFNLTKRKKFSILVDLFRQIFNVI